MLSRILLTVATAAAVSPFSNDPWAPVRDIVSSEDAIWVSNLSRGFVFTAGNASGRQFTYERGHKASQRLLLASASKFPAALAIAGAVADGHLTFDTHAHEVFGWWSASPTDPRSGVTLRQLLSFTSGFYWDDPSSGAAKCMSSLDGSIIFSPEECAKQIYERAPFKYKPGTTFAYNSFHLQIAGAMAAKAAGISLQQLLHKYLIDKLQLKRTEWLLGQNPQLAAGMTSTADDYDVILRSYMAYELVPKAVADEMERDYLSPPYASQICDWCDSLTDYFGHYSMSNWYECLHSWAGGATSNVSWTPQCANDRIHMDLGLFGWYPLLDRKKGVYFQIAQQVIAGLNSTNPGCEGATLLRLQVKPAVDRALGHVVASAEDISAAVGSNDDEVATAAAVAVAAASARLGYDNTPASLWTELSHALDAQLREEEAAAAVSAAVAGERSWAQAARDAMAAALEWAVSFA